MPRFTLVPAAIIVALMLTSCASPPGAVSPDPTPTTTPTVTSTPAVTQVPAVEPSVIPAPAQPVLTVTTTDTMSWTPEWLPPTYDGVYRLIDGAHGFPLDGTRYVLSHARTGITGERSPGNDWLDANAQPGGIVLLDGVRYIVTAAGDIDKDHIADAPIWGPNDGNRAVLVTCRAQWATQATANHYIALEKENKDG
jgi:hypothetical protein